MSRGLLPGLRPASPRWLNLLAHVVGRHGGHLKRAQGCGQPAWSIVSGFMIATSAGHYSNQSRSVADTSGRGWTIHILGNFTLWNRATRSPRMSELLLFYRLARCAASCSARSGKKLSLIYTWALVRGLPAKGKGAGTPTLGRSSSLGRFCSKAQIGK